MMKHAWVVGAVAVVVATAIVAAMNVTHARNFQAVAVAAVTGLNAREGSPVISLTAKRTGGSIIVTLTNVSGKILSVVPPAEYTLRQKFVDEKGEVTEGGNSAIMAQAPADLAMVVEDLQPGETRTFSWLIMRMVVSGVTPEPGSSKFVAMYNGPAWSWEAVAKKHEVVGYMSRYSNPVDW